MVQYRECCHNGLIFNSKGKFCFKLLNTPWELEHLTEVDLFEASKPNIINVAAGSSHKDKLSKRIPSYLALITWSTVSPFISYWAAVQSPWIVAVRAIIIILFCLFDLLFLDRQHNNETSWFCCSNNRSKLRALSRQVKKLLRSLHLPLTCPL